MAEAAFEEAKKKAEEGKVKMMASNDNALTAYALFKQATVGDCDTTRPGMFDLKGKAKWDAWDGKKGMSKEDAMQAYADHVDKVLAE